MVFVRLFPLRNTHIKISTMKKKLVLFKSLTFLFVMLNLPFQGYSITTFEKTTKFNGNQSAWAFVLMDDGGYVATGFTNPSGTNDQNMLVVRYDMYGEPVWTKSIGGPNVDWGYYIIKSSDGNLVVAGSTANKGAGSDDFYLIKMDYAGTIIWERTYGTAASEIARGVCETKDGGFCIAGYTTLSSTNADGYIVKTNSDGSVVQWSKTIGGTGDDHFYSIRQNADQSYIVTGGTNSATISAGDMDLYLVKFGSQGNLIWEKAFGGVNFDEGKYVNLTPDGKYVVSGEKSPQPGNEDGYILKTDTAGIKIWDQSFGGTNKDLFRSIENTSDGGFIVGGISRSFGLVYPYMWLLKINDVGAAQWQKLFGGDNGHQHCYQAKPTPDGGYLMLGHSFAFSGGLLFNVYMVKTNATGSVVAGIAEHNEISGLSIFPNPAINHISIQLKSMKALNYTIRISNIIGAEIYSTSDMLNEGINTKTISISDLKLKTGIYFLELSSGNFIRTEKILIKE
jgi:hypothetical protein